MEQYASFPGPMLKGIKPVIRTAADRHQMQLAPIINGSRKVI
jgi:hypothetical protein